MTVRVKRSKELDSEGREQKISMARRGVGVGSSSYKTRILPETLSSYLII